MTDQKVSIVKKIYSYWCYIWLFLPGALLIPFQFLFTLSEKTHFLGHFGNRVWGHILLPMSLLPVKVKRLGKKPKVAVYCPNHSSYLDIPSLFWTVPGFFVILGKKEVAKMPVLGYIFKKLYITVDRNSAESRRKTLSKCKEALKKGKSLALFPEGRINNSNVPKLSPFQDGAFLLAIEQQIPIVPVTFPRNWIILPNGQQYLNQGTIHATVHEPIPTIGLTIKDIPELKAKTFEVIENELKRQLKDDYK